MRVLHVIPWFYPAVTYGGPILSVFRVCHELTRLGDEIRVLTTDADGRMRIPAGTQRSPEVRDLNVHYAHCWYTGRCIAPGMLVELGNEMAKVDLIHLTMVYEFATLPTLLLSRLHDKPLVWSPRGTLQRWTKSNRIRAKATFEVACRLMRPRRTVLHLTSEEERAESLSQLGFPDSQVIPNGVDVPAAYKPPPLGRALKMLYLGRLDPKKGLENLLEAGATLTSSGILEWSLNIAGDGEPRYVDSLRQKVIQMGVNDRVQFLGRVDGQRKTKVINGCDLFVAPSFTENFGISIAEALAHGRAVIAGRGTPWSGLEIRQCGIWTSNAPDSLAAAIRKMSKSDLTTLGRNGREWMQAEFSWADRARQMHQLYERIAT